jgi:hypothetical protein
MGCFSFQSFKRKISDIGQPGCAAVDPDALNVGHDLILKPVAKAGQSCRHFCETLGGETPRLH